MVARSRNSRGALCGSSRQEKIQSDYVNKTVLRRQHVQFDLNSFHLEYDGPYAHHKGKSRATPDFTV